MRADAAAPHQVTLLRSLDRRLAELGCRLGHFWLLAVAALLLLTVWAGISRVSADRGVAIDLGSISIERNLAKGGSYTLPTIGVRNPGDETTRYRMSVTYFEGQSQSRPGGGWLDFSPAEFELRPGATQPVNVELNIPPGARPGDYAALLQAGIVTEGEGAEVGGAAGTRLSFTVKPSNFLEAWSLWLQEFLEDQWLIILILVGGSLTVAVIWWARTHLSFRVERK